jgi:hypothetical protein
VFALLLPPVLLLMLDGLPSRLLPDWDRSWKVTVALLVGWLFLLREFRIYAVLLCWAYFGPMMWVSFFIEVFISPFFHPSSYC